MYKKLCYVNYLKNKEGSPSKSGNDGKDGANKPFSGIIRIRICRIRGFGRKMFGPEHPKEDLCIMSSTWLDISPSSFSISQMCIDDSHVASVVICHVTKREVIKNTML